MKPLVGHVFEALIAVAVILTFFSGLQVFLHVVFPSDAGLGALIAGMRSPAGTDLRVPDDARLLHSEGLGEAGPVAELTGVKNDVTTRRGSNLAWGTARRGMRLYNRDAVQTRSRSAASIAFRRRGRLDLGSNTHVIISSNDSDIFSSQRRSSVLMIDGQLRGRLLSGPGEPVELEVTLPGGSTRITSESGGGEDVEFRISVNADSATSVVMDRGVAEVIADGDTVTVKSSQYTTVSKDSAPSTPTALSSPVKPVGPVSGEVFNFRNLSPQVEFKWSADDAFSGYRILIAADPAFSDIVHDEVVEEPHLTHGNLSAGTYYWRVYGLKGGFEITVSNTRVFHLSQTIQPPKLLVYFPDEPVESAVFDLKGRTERGTRVLVGGEEAKVDARGHFVFRLHLEPGLNVVVVEAVDKLGNVSYKSQVVNSKP
jgi:hypothetical protein